MNSPSKGQWLILSMLQAEREIERAQKIVERFHASLEKEKKQWTRS